MPVAQLRRRTGRARRPRRTLFSWGRSARCPSRAPVRPVRRLVRRHDRPPAAQPAWIGHHGVDSRLGTTTTSAAWTSSRSGWPSHVPDQPHRVLQQQVAGVDPQRPEQVPVADDHQPRLRVVPQDGRHRLEQHVGAVALVQVADVEERRVDRADLVAGLDRAGVELAPRSAAPGTAARAGTTGRRSPAATAGPPRRWPASWISSAPRLAQPGRARSRSICCG